MTLEAALRTFIMGLVAGPVSFVQNTGETGTLLRVEGVWRESLQDLVRYPLVNLSIRETTRQKAKATAFVLHSAFDVRGPLELTDSITISRSEASGLPQPLGKDGAGLFRYSLDLLLTTTQQTQI